MKKILKYLMLVTFMMFTANAGAQELFAKIKINSNKVQGTDKSVFENLEQTLTQFVNERQWTQYHFQQNERIVCNFNITISKYDPSTNVFECTALIQANRPVYNSAYNSVLFSNSDKEFNFEFEQFEQLNFNEDNVDNQLTALFAYYAYMIIGMDLDSFAVMGGEDILQKCVNLVNNAQNLQFPGWKAFEDDRNRFALINDYMDPSLKPMRQLQYDYYRLGLDEMESNVERGRTAVSDALEKNLKKAHEDRPMSLLPQIWTEYKNEELSGIYKGKGTQKEKEKVYQILFDINPSQNRYWDKIKE